MKSFTVTAATLLGLAVLVLAAFSPAPASACSGRACTFDGTCAGDERIGQFCVSVLENGYRLCEMIQCEPGGGGGRYPTAIKPAPMEEGAKPSTLEQFRGLTREQALELCAKTPGCYMGAGNSRFGRASPTWGALKILYR